MNLLQYFIKMSSQEQYLTNKIFVEYYNKLVIEMNKIIKRVDKLEKNFESILPNNSASINNESTDNRRSSLNNEDRQNKKKNNKKKTNISKRKNEQFKVNQQNSKTQENFMSNTVNNITNIFTKDNEINYYQSTPYQPEKSNMLTDRNKINNVSNFNNLTNYNNLCTRINNNPKLIDYSEFSFKNILSVSTKTNLHLKNQKSVLPPTIQSITSPKQSLSKKDNEKKLPIPVSQKNSKISSDIIKTTEETNLLLVNIIPNFNKIIKNKKIDFNLLYKATKDGDEIKIFHKLCDKQKNIVVAIETKNGCRFGGYTKIGFDSDEESKKDDAAFLFSFDKMKIYKIKKDSVAIACFSKSGPCFFGTKSDTIHIVDKFFENFSHTDKKNSIYEGMEEDYELNKGEDKFLIRELEIFKIEIE